MSKKYMDFVPKTSAKPKKPTPKPAKPKKPATPPVKSVTPKKPASKPVSKNTSLGVIEELSPKARQTHASKSHFTPKASELKTAKAQKVGLKAPATPTKSAVPAKTQATKPGLKPTKNTYQPPKTPFINQDKVKKRPLSKNIYRKTPTSTKETPQKPVTIISKPGKDSNIGLVVAIILTIILGAAAGTIAYLLLPK